MGWAGLLALTAKAPICSRAAVRSAERSMSGPRAKRRSEDRDDTLAFTVFGHHADAGGQSVGRTGDAEDLTLEANRPCRGRLQAVNGAGHFGATCAHESGQSDNFTTPERETDVAIDGLAGQSGNFQ
jgi:hypothetical protein